MRRYSVASDHLKQTWDKIITDKNLVLQEEYVSSLKMLLHVGNKFDSDSLPTSEDINHMKIGV